MKRKFYISLFASIFIFLFSFQIVFAAPLQIGWWTAVGISDMSRIDTQKAAGETLMVAYSGSSGDTTAYLNKIQQAGVKAYLEVDQTAAANGDTNSIVSYVNTYKNNSAIAGWYLFDEPEFAHPSSANLIAVYNAIKAADPSRPVSIAFGNGYCSYAASTSDPNYFKAADIIMFDQYPVHDQPEFQNTATNHNKITDVLDVVNDCLSYINSHVPGKKFIPIEQGFNWGGTGPAGLPSRDPTYGEERYFTFMPLIHKIDGLTYWIDYKSAGDATLTANVNRVMKEASSLSNFLGSGTFNDPSVTNSNSNITYKYGNDGTNTYLIAVSNTINSQTAKFTLPTNVTAASATLINDAFNGSNYQSRSIAISNHSFSDNFTSFQVHIYQLGGSTGGGGNPTASPVPTNAPKPGDLNNDGVVDGIDYVLALTGHGDLNVVIANLH